MAYIFEKQYFKRYLHRNCHRNWFSKKSDNAKYKTEQGSTRDVTSYSNEYTIRVKDLLVEPQFEARKAGGIIGRNAGAMGAFGGGIAFLSFLTETVASGGVSLIPALAAGGTATFSGIGAVAANELAEGNAEINFKITGDDSEWVAKLHIENRRIICKWSNEVYEERYEQQRSSEYQYHIEHRPPTPY